MWDITSAGASVEAEAIFEGHSGVVEDVAWHRHHPYLLGSVSDDRQLMMCVRQPIVHLSPD